MTAKGSFSFRLLICLKGPHSFPTSTVDFVSVCDFVFWAERENGRGVGKGGRERGERERECECVSVSVCVCVFVWVQALRLHFAKKKVAWRGFKRVSGERCWFCWNTNKDIFYDDKEWDDDNSDDDDDRDCESSDDDDNDDVEVEVVGGGGCGGGGGGGCQNQRRRKFATLFGLEIGRLLAFETIVFALKRLTMVGICDWTTEMRSKMKHTNSQSRTFKILIFKKRNFWICDKL